LERIEKKLGYDGVVWHHLKYNNKELAEVYNQIGRQKVDVLVNSRDVRCVWVVPPDSSSPLKVELASGWAQAILKLHGDRPIHASAWDKDVKLLREHLKTRISPFVYEKEMSRVQRDNLLRTAEKTTKIARKQSEREKEASRKSISAKVLTTRNSQSIVVGASEKSQAAEGSEVEREEIDWDNLPSFPTDNFPKEA
jgi:hypothetical protein